MARPISTIESHPQRQKIISALAADTPYVKISAWTDPPVTPMALSRYKKTALDAFRQTVIAAKNAIINKDKDMPVVFGSAVNKAALAVATDPFVVTALKSAARRDRWIDDLEAAPDIDAYRVLATLDKNDLAAQEYQARLAGRLDNVTHLQVAVVIPSQPSAPTSIQEDVITLDIKASR